MERDKVLKLPQRRLVQFAALLIQSRANLLFILIAEVNQNPVCLCAGNN